MNSKIVRPANILFCEGNTDGTIGGSFYSLLYLVSGLNRSRYRPIVVFHHDHALIPEFRKANIPTFVIPKPMPFMLKAPEGFFLKTIFPFLHFVHFVQNGVNFFKLFLKTSVQYARFMKKHDIDLLHLNNSIVHNHDWMMGAALAGVKAVTRERGINKHYSKMSRFFAKRLKAIICISHAVRDNLIASGVNFGNLVTIYNGIDPRMVSIDKNKEQVRLAHGIQEDQIVIGVIGNIKAWKGQETIIRALPKIISRFPKVVCLLVGDTAKRDQLYKDRLDKLIGDLQIKGQVIFTGYRPNVANYLNLAQVVVHTSVEPEPFGRVLIEAMSLRKPLIATAFGAVPEIIEQGITGWTTPPGNVEVLADTVLGVLGDPSMAFQVGAAGYQRLLENFLISFNVEKTMSLYDSLLDACCFFLL